jgi:hypothetical protein
MNNKGIDNKAANAPIINTSTLLINKLMRTSNKPENKRVKAVKV